jgi:hypothetical protein
MIRMRVNAHPQRYVFAQRNPVSLTARLFRETEKLVSLWGRHGVPRYEDYFD